MTRPTQQLSLDREREQREIRERGLDTVAGAFAYPGGEDLVKPGLGNRRRTRIVIDTPDGPTQWYLKRYGALPLSRRIRLALGKGRFCEAEREFANVQAATKAGVPTMQALAWGQTATFSASSEAIFSSPRFRAMRSNAWANRLSNRTAKRKWRS